MSNPFGIGERSFRIVEEALVRYPEIECAKIFGSRAMGNCMGTRVGESTVRKLSTYLNEEVPIPYKADAIRKQNEDERRRLADLRGAAFAEAQRLAARIEKLAPGVEQVILFGSVAEDTIRDADFDLDLAIVGGDSYLVEDIVSESSFKVDVVDYERLPEHLQRRIDERGVALIRR
jgi:Nucleotidyltransferase domain.